MNIEELKNLVGKKYQLVDSFGNFISCLEPMYLLYPALPKYKKKEGKSCFEFALVELKKNLKEISEKEIKAGDIIVFYKFQRTLHIAIYLGEGKAIHADISGKYEIIRIKNYKALIKGVFRYA